MKKCLTILVCICLLLGCMPFITAYASEQTTASQSESTEAQGQTTRPISVYYVPIDLSEGCALGTISITMPSQSNATSFSVYWGDAMGNKLPGYGALCTGKITSSPALVSLSENFTVPSSAKSILVYTSNEQYGDCPLPYRLDLPKFTLPETGKQLAEFVVVSDLHLGRDKIAEKNFIAMLKDVTANASSASGIIVVGDVVDTASDTNYALFDQLYASVSGAPPVFWGIGDGEYLTPDSYAYDANAHKTNLQKFLSHVKTPTGVTLYTSYYTYFMGGCNMIFLGADSYKDGNAVYSEAQLNWLKAVLAQTSLDKPAFVFMHEPLPNTVSGSTHLQGYGNVYNYLQVQSIIEQYSNVVMFNGHTHWTMDAERTMYKFKNGAKAFNTASVASLWIDQNGTGNELAGSQGYYVTVYEEAILVRGRDFTTGQWIPQAEYLLSTKQPVVTTEADTTPPKTTTATTNTEAETQEEEESMLSELATPLLILACMAVIVFILVFRKPQDSEA